MIVKIKLLSNAILGDGTSVPGAEDISILLDEDGFPYYKGTSFKGILREEVKDYTDDKDILELFKNSNLNSVDAKTIRFSNFELSGYVKKTIKNEIKNRNLIIDSLTSLHAFTRIAENGIAQDKSLRLARSANKGLCFYGEVNVDGIDEEKKKVLINVIRSIRFIGTMRNRGFGKVLITVEE